jgi:hypothetical protein
MTTPSLAVHVHQCWNFLTIYSMEARNQVGIGLSYQARQATYVGCRHWFLGIAWAP